MIIGTAVAVIVLLAMSGFFSGSETALTAASRARMHQLEKDGDPRAARVNRLISRRERLIGAILLGNNAVNILASALTTSLFISLFAEREGGAALATAAATALMTVLVLIFAEVLPKTLAITRADAMAMVVARPIGWIVAAVGWVVAMIEVIVYATLRLVGVDPSHADTDPEQEIRGAIDLHHSEGGVEAEERHRLVGALDLKGMTLEEVMIHRKNISMLDVDLRPRDLVMKALSSPHTRIPLYRGDQEEIVGVLHAKDLLRAIAPLGGDLDSLSVLEIAREPWFVPETTPLQDQLDAFLTKRNHFALIVDEYGALQGLVTLEDILEEIVGDIRDEHDVVVQGVRPQQDGSANVDGWVTIRDLNRSRGWDLPDEEAVTVAGLVIHEAQTIPDPGQCFKFHGYRFDILRRNRNQITALRVHKEEDGEAEDAA
ncbi:MAG: HlyC/CorC family transporter [Pseudomonadota bacterium]